MKGIAMTNSAFLQIFYGILVQHFANLAGAQPISLAALDVLTVHILELTAEVPYYAATVARARLQKAQQRLNLALTSQNAAAESCWPGESSTWTLLASFTQHMCLVTVEPLLAR